MAANQPMAFRSRGATVVGVLLLLFVVGNWIDLAIQGRDHGSVVAAAALLLTTGIGYVAALRPRLLADDTGITVQNPLRDHRIGWATVAKVDLGDLLRVHCEYRVPGEGTTRRQVINAWAVHHSRRRQYTAEARARRAAFRRSGYRPRAAPGYGTPYGTPAYASTAAATIGSAAERTARLLNERAIGGEGSEALQRAEPPQSTWNRTAIAAVLVPALILLVVCLV